MTPTRGEDARNAIVAATDNPRIEVFQADLSRIGSVRALAGAVQRAYPSLDILVSCAAVFAPRRMVTVDGLEAMFATNHLAPFLLTNLLLDRLGAAPSARVLMLTAPSTVRPDLDDLQAARRFRALSTFGASKAANLLFTYAMARRLEGSPITANAVHPGLVRSSLMRQAPAPLRWATWIASRSADEAARDILPLAISDAYAGASGRFFHRGREIGSAPFTHDVSLQDRLWEASAMLADLPEPSGAQRARPGGDAQHLNATTG